MNTPELEHKVSEFHTIEALNSAGISESSIAELNHIVHNLLQDPRTLKALSFTDELDKHLRNTNAHDIKLNQSAPDLIIELYNSYRDAGYTGTIQDMCIAIEKDVTVASHSTMVNAWSDTEAVNTKEWRWRFNQHFNNTDAHKELLDIFRPQYCLNISPILSLDYRYISTERVNLTSYPIDYWNEPDGTINIEICFNYKEDIDKDIIRLVADTTEFTVHLHIANEVVTITCGFTGSDPMGTIRYTTEDRLPEAFIERISITYNRNRYAIRDLFKTFNIIRPAGDFIPHTLKTELPLRKDHNSLRTLSIYREGISISEQNFFLN